MISHHEKNNIRINGVCPGKDFKPISRSRGMTVDMRYERKNLSSLKHEWTPWEFAHGQ